LSITIFNGGSHCATGADYHRPQVSGRPTFHPELAEFFKTLREAAGIRSFRQAVSIAARRSKTEPIFKAITPQTLRGLEKGTTKNPNPQVLRAVAELYRVPYADLAQRFFEKGFELAKADESQTVDAPVAPPASDAVGLGGPHVSPATSPFALTPEDLATLQNFVAAAVAIIQLGTRFFGDTDQILGGHVAAPRARPAKNVARHPPRRRSTAQRSGRKPRKIG
jgi:transcriptional regulator with XRE-family HTH domain